MTDTVKIRIYRTELEDDYQNLLEQRLGISDITRKKNGLMVFMWEVGNMKIRLDERALWIEGSLTKYSVGDNLKSADKEQLKAAIDKLGDILGVDLYKGVVTRLDIAANIRTMYPVKEYYPFLINLSRLNRNELHNGLSFGNTLRYVSFYDKIKEMKRKKEVEVDDAFVNQHILRYECKYTAVGLAILLKVKNPTLQYVFNRYNDILLHWKNTFDSIDKGRQVCEPTSEMFSVRGGLETYFAIKGIISDGGLKKVLDMIDIAKGRKYFDRYPNQSSNMKSRLKKIMASTLYFQNSKLVEELEAKVTMIYQYALARC